ncbi:MAG: hypothetical protein II920_07290, partial [Clostridia bacterium]|nr:hypothetical protein [Clostridia bacterium]
TVPAVTAYFECSFGDPAPERGERARFAGFHQPPVLCKSVCLIGFPSQRFCTNCKQYIIFLQICQSSAA